ncbi:MAG: FGGY-family carbohydrate kinase [Acidimicrobiales bacterium]|nr:FGGY-family carbohydrate kinase [Acidimicrobiales bacterium]
MQVLVIDVGTSGIRAAAVDPDGTIISERHVRAVPSTPMPGLVEFDASHMAHAALETAQAVLAEVGEVAAVGIANQRASTVVWERDSGTPVGPGIGWQDLRTVGECLALQADDIRLAPNQSATKLAHLLDAADPDRSGDLCFGTVDSWLVWHLTGGTHHVTDRTNAAVTGLLTGDAGRWNERVLDALRIPESCLPTVVDSAGVVGPATALAGAPPITGIAGDQQASLVGQGCVRPGMTKITFGTGGMLDMWLGDDAPASAERGPAGTFPIVAMSRGGTTSWGLEAIMLSAGSNLDWLVEDLGLLSDAAESHEVAASCADSGGVVYVPALLGLGTPQWDYGARGTLLGITRGSDRSHIVRAVLEGIAHRGADLVEAAEAESGRTIDQLRVDGGMSANPTFVQALADATGKVVEISPVLEATTLGAAYLAALGADLIEDERAIAQRWEPRERVEPTGRLDRDQWRTALERAAGWHGELSALDF